jgi:hypothetical protein
MENEGSHTPTQQEVIVDGLPICIPDASEIALVAATLYPVECRGIDAEAALKKALGLIQAAGYVRTGFAKLSDQDRAAMVIGWMADLGFSKTLLSDRDEAVALRLYAKNVTDDPVKNYLAKHWPNDSKTTRAVREAIRKFFIANANHRNHQAAKKQMILLENNAGTKQLSQEELKIKLATKIRWVDGDRKYVEFFQIRQFPSPSVDEQTSQPIWPKPEYWILLPDMLEELIAWRTHLKKERVSWKSIRANTREEILDEILPRETPFKKNKNKK